MADTARTRTALETLLANNQTGAISAQDLRDLLASVVIQSNPQDIKVYRAMITQTGTDDPVEARLFENSLSDDVAWTRISEGVFHCTLADEFVVNNTFVMASSLTVGVQAFALVPNANYIQVSGVNATPAVADVEGLYIEIIVYP